MFGSISQINVSSGGILKRPVLFANVNSLGIEGDSHAHPRIHGGRLKALLLIGTESIQELNALGFELFSGALGENLTTTGLDRRLMRLGQRYQIGDVVVGLTSIRRSCSAMDVYGPDLQTAVYDPTIKKGDTSSPKWGLSGFYAAVLRPGIIRPGDAIELLP